MTGASTSLDSLKRARPEWLPWLAVLGEVARECQATHWERALPAATSPPGGVAPLLAGAEIAVQTATVRGWSERLLRLAAAGATGAMQSLARVRPASLDSVALFAASLRYDDDAVRAVAAAHDADPEALQAVVAFLPVPFLQTVNRRLASSVPASWTAGYCPVCGAWPAFAEVRGIERSRHFRCGRCGGEWYARALVCPFCSTADHDRLAALVPEKSDAGAAIDACNACRGYVKVFTRLQGCAPDTVMVDDLASVELDMAALEHGYARPSGAGCPVEVSVVETSRPRRLFGWYS
jgi:FdhE protein